jgi:putative membrane protein
MTRKVRGHFGGKRFGREPAMANRRRFRIVDGLTIASGAAALLLLTSAAPHNASAPLPWAATSGLHFVEAVVNADNYRAKAGGLAMKKSPSPDVRDFGRALWVDSIEDTRNLQWVLDKIDPHPFLPTTVTPQYMFVIDELLPVTGAEFDRRFIAQQTASLTQALALARAYARFGDDFDLKEYAKRSAPKIEARLAQVRRIGMRYG